MGRMLMDLETLLFESIYGYDSIRTIRTVYDRGEDGLGAYRCPFPNCSFARFDAYQLWRHMILGPAHPDEGQAVRRWRKFLKRLDDPRGDVAALRWDDE